MDNWTGFLRHLMHLSTGVAATGSGRLILVAGLMGIGMNYGLSKMAGLGGHRSLECSVSFPGCRRTEEYLPHITPLGWEHITLIRQYSFTHQSGRSLDNLRPLRLPDQEGQPGRELTKTETLEVSEA